MIPWSTLVIAATSTLALVARPATAEVRYAIAGNALKVPHPVGVVAGDPCP